KIALPGAEGGGENAAPAQSGPGIQPGTPAAVAETSTDGTTLKLEIESLKRGDGDLVTAKFKVTNTGTDSFYSLSKWGSSSTIDGVYLVDPAGKKKYLPVK